MREVTVKFTFNEATAVKDYPDNPENAAEQYIEDVKSGALDISEEAIFCDSFTVIEVKYP
jgi:hypothetical protein